MNIASNEKWQGGPAALDCFTLTFNSRRCFYIFYLCSSKQDIFWWLLRRSPPTDLPGSSSLSTSPLPAAPGSTFRDPGRILPEPQTPTPLSLFLFLFPPAGLDWWRCDCIPTGLVTRKRRGGGPEIENGSFSSAGPPSDRHRSHHVTNAVNVPACSPLPANQGSAARLLRCTSRRKQFQRFCLARFWVFFIKHTFENASCHFGGKLGPRLLKKKKKHKKLVWDFAGSGSGCFVSSGAAESVSSCSLRGNEDF